MPILTEIEKAYLAGIVDGEGCVGVAFRKAGGGRSEAKYLTPTLQVTNTKRELLEWISQRYGGSLYERSDVRKTRKTNWLWFVAGQKALMVIRDIRPYLLLKTEQADLLLTLPRQSTKARDALGRIKGVMTEEDFRANKLVVMRIRELNYRGVPTNAPN